MPRRGLRSRKLPVGFWAGAGKTGRSTKKTRLNRKVATVGVVKRLLGRAMETKYVTKNVESNIVHNSQISAPDMIPILPTCNQGTDDFQRVGDTIRPNRLHIRGLISIDEDGVSSNQVLYVRVMVLNPRNAKSYATSVSQYPTYANNLLKMNLDSGTAVTPFIGNQTDLHYKPNPDLFTVLYDKIFKIAPSNKGGMETQPSSCVRWSKNLKIPKVLHYQDGLNTPQNFAPFYALGYVYADGTGPDVLTTKIITTTDCTMFYKDA